MDASNRSSDDDERRELSLTIRLTGQTAQRMRRAAAIQQRPVEEVAAECVRDELGRDLYDALYANVEDYAATLDGLAQRLALIVRELGGLPSGAAARVIALAQAEKGGHFPDVHERMVGQLTRMWAGRTIEYGKRPDGSVGPLEDSKVEVTVTPEQWDALARIGAPDSLGSGAQRAMDTGIESLDR